MVIFTPIVRVEEYMYKVLYDKRWTGEHGIGRFAKEIADRIKFDAFIDNKLRPTNPLDVFITPWYLKSSKCLYFTPGFNAPFFFADKSIITIHDLNHIDIKGNDSLLKSLYYEYILKRGCRKCLKIFTVSEFSKSRIVEWSNVNPEKVVVVGNGVSSGFSPKGEIFLPGFEYFLCVSNRKKHKNEKRLIDAFAILREKYNIKLLFSGSPNDQINRYIEFKNLTKEIIFCGRISENDFPKYYRGAKGLLMPSLYEGFGLPVIEAMACGVPVLASNTTALGELATGCAITIDPNSIDEMVAGMETLITDQDVRNTLINKGLERSKNFSWDETARIIKHEINHIKLRLQSS